MDTALRNVQQRRATKPPKPKKKPIKVVYISNPRRVETSASEFRALVQELTGQDAELPDPGKFSEADDDVGSHRAVPEAAKVPGDDHALLGVPSGDPGGGPEIPENSDLSFEPYDDVFVPYMTDNFGGSLPSSVVYESSQVDHMLRSFDAV
ncbi:sigma factor binding protein 1, chloroplastic-like [Malania oleifera]|uniref:sigma factor binding protein 1, chloroplastic-like n=1 Tax=Malania oleifera TaxID=397392 RepID=UPI0025AE2029|nr:sigma factor binding protein 1, chloroplastic-like [Malania oleifera]